MWSIHYGEMAAGTAYYEIFNLLFRRISLVTLQMINQTEFHYIKHSNFEIFSKFCLQAHSSQNKQLFQNKKKHIYIYVFDTCEYPNNRMDTRWCDYFIEKNGHWVIMHPHLLTHNESVGRNVCATLGYNNDSFTSKYICHKHSSASLFMFQNLWSRKKTPGYNIVHLSCPCY